MTPEQALRRAAKKPVTHAVLANFAEGIGKAVREQIAAATVPLLRHIDLLEERQKLFREVVEHATVKLELTKSEMLVLQRDVLALQHDQLRGTEE